MMVRNLGTVTAEMETLFRAAVESLKEEDAALRHALALGGERTGIQRDAARGLAYWLFETTLVYFIFRKWAEIADVAWEHAVGEAGLRPLPEELGRKAASERCDLVLLDPLGGIRVAFEAKWWNNRRGGLSILADAKKLRRTCMNADKYVVAFWYSTVQESESDLAEASDFCSREKLELSFVGTFETELIGRTRGNFAVAFIRV